jgi:nitrite reductase (NADH) small subunit
MQKILLGLAADVPVGTAREFVADGRVLAVFATEEGYVALHGLCAHAGGPLAKGKVQGGVVTCPWHGWQYWLKTGQHCLSSGVLQERYDIIVEDEQLWVMLPTNEV